MIAASIFAAAERVEQIARIVEPHFYRERRVVCIQPRQQRWNLRPRHMSGNAKREPASIRGQACNRTVMRGEEV